MTTPNIRAALERLVKTDDGCSAAEWSDAIAAARTALAEPVPEGPSDEDLLELRRGSSWLASAEECISISRAALALSRLTPQPVTPTTSDVTELFYVTTLSRMIARLEQNRIYGEGILITLEDEGGGAFFTLKDTSDVGGEIRIEMEELELVVIEARKLIKQIKLETNG